MANKIKFEDITPCPWNTRGKITKESVKGLAECIKNTALLMPIVLWKRPDASGYYCVAGCRRLAALKMIGKPLGETQYRIITGDEAFARTATINENLQREKTDPIREAQEVAKLMAEGKKPETIAAETGYSVSWVNRRAKLTALNADIMNVVKEAPSRFDTAALEMIAELPEKAQADVYKDMTNRMKYDNQFKLDAAMARQWTTKFSSNLDAEAFVKKCGDCKKCDRRTGCQSDLFGITDGKLGECLDKKCFNEHKRTFEQELIRKATDNAEEVVRFPYSWQMPDEKETRPKRDKKHPCAYVFVEGDKVTVRWGESIKAKQEREAAEQEARDAKRDADNERRNRVSGVCDKVREACESYAESPAFSMNATAICKDFAKLNEAQREFVVDAVLEAIGMYRSNHEVANFMRLFDWVAELSGVTDEEKKAVLDEFPAEEE